MKFLVPNYSCLQNPRLGGCRPQIPGLSVLNWICWTPPLTEQNSWVRHWIKGTNTERGSRASVEMQSWCLPGWTETNHEAFHVKIASAVRDETRTSTSLTEVWSVTTVLASSVQRSLSSEWWDWNGEIKKGWKKHREKKGIMRGGTLWSLKEKRKLSGYDAIRLGPPVYSLKLSRNRTTLVNVGIHGMTSVYGRLILCSVIFFFLINPERTVLG